MDTVHAVSTYGNAPMSFKNLPVADAAQMQNEIVY
jgi:hypothetical protein